MKAINRSQEKALVMLRAWGGWISAADIEAEQCNVASVCALVARGLADVREMDGDEYGRKQWRAIKDERTVQQYQDWYEARSKLSLLPIHTQYLIDAQYRLEFLQDGERHGGQVHSIIAAAVGYLIQAARTVHTPKNFFDVLMRGEPDYLRGMAFRILDANDLN